MKIQTTKKNYIFIIVAAAFWGCIGVFLKMLTASGLTSFQSVSVRTILSAVFYTAYLAITDREKLKLHIKDIKYFLGTGIVSLIFFNWCYFNTISRSSLAVAAVLLYTAPIFVTLLSAIIFKEKLTGKKIVALILTFTGCILVTGVLSGGESALTPIAILFGFGSGIGYALYSIFSIFALRKYSPETVTVYTFIVAAIAVIPSTILGDYSTVNFSLNFVIGSLGISIVCCILPYIFYTRGLTGVEAGQASIIATLEPVVAAFIGTIFYHEPLTITCCIGIILVIGAIALLNLKQKKEKGCDRVER